MMIGMNAHLIIDAFVLAYPGLLAIDGFGSQFSGEASNDSDLDLAILINGKVPVEVLWEQRGQIEGLVNLPVDLLDLRAASTVMQYQVITQGVRLGNRDAQADIFESFILSEKTELDTARADLIRKKSIGCASRCPWCFYLT
jgi:predicted nucleotidyltransferase